MGRFSKHVRAFSADPNCEIGDTRYIPFGHLSLALRVNLETWFGICVTNLATGALQVWNLWRAKPHQWNRQWLGKQLFELQILSFRNVDLQFVSMAPCFTLSFRPHFFSSLLFHFSFGVCNGRMKSNFSVTVKVFHVRSHTTDNFSKAATSFVHTRERRHGMQRRFLCRNTPKLCDQGSMSIPGGSRGPVQASWTRLLNCAHGLEVLSHNLVHSETVIFHHIKLRSDFWR